MSSLFKHVTKHAYVEYEMYGVLSSKIVPNGLNARAMSLRMEEPRIRLKRARLAAGYRTPTEAAKALRKLNKNTLISNENGNRPISRKMAEVYGHAFGVPPGWLLYGETTENTSGLGRSKLDNNPNKFVDVHQADYVPIECIAIVGEVAAGVWVEHKLTKNTDTKVAVAPDPRYPLEMQFGLLVRGRSIDRFAADGDILHCVSVLENGSEPIEGDLVIVERRRDDGKLIETSAKILQKRPHLKLLPYSNDPKFQEPLVLNSILSFEQQDIAIVAKVLSAVRKWQPDLATDDMLL